MRKLVILGVGALLLAGCGGEEEGGGGGGAEAQIVPLAVGNWWAYRDVNDTTKVDTTKIVDDTVYNGHDAYLAVIQSDTTADTGFVYYSDGYLWVAVAFTFDTVTDTVEMKWVKEDPQVGDQWVVLEREDSINYGGVPAVFRMVQHAKVEGTEDKSVPAGDFPGCYVVRYDDTTQVLVNGNPVYTSTSASKAWFYKGVGSVYGSDSSSGGWQDSELLDYYLVQ